MIFNATIVTKVKYFQKRCCLPLGPEAAFLFFDWITSTCTSSSADPACVNNLTLLQISEMYLST